MIDIETIKVVLKAVYEGKRDVNDAIKDMQKLEKETKEVAKETEKAAKDQTKAQKAFERGIQKLASSMGLAGGKAGTLVQAIGNITTSSALAVTAMVALTVVIVKLSQHIWELSQYAMDFAWQLKDVAMRTGSSVEEMSKFNIVAQKSGMSLEEFSKLIEVFDLKMANMQSGGTKTIEALKRMGIEATDSAGNLKATINIWDEFARKAENLGYLDRSEVATDIFGRLGSQKALRAIDAYTQKMEYAERLMERYNQDSIQGWMQMKGVMQDLGILWQIMKLQLADMFLPMMEHLIPATRAFMDFVTQSKTLVAIGIVLREVFEVIGGALGWVVDIITGIFILFDDVYNLLANLLTGTMTIGQTVETFFEDLLKTLAGVFARPFVWLWDNLQQLIIALDKFGIALVKSYAEDIDIVGDAISHMSITVIQGISDLAVNSMTLVEKFVNGIIDVMNGFLAGVNKLSGWIQNATGLQVATNLSLDRVSFADAKSSVSSYFGGLISGTQDRFSNLSGKLIDQLQKEQAMWENAKNPFEQFLFTGGTKTGLLTDQQTDFGGDRYFRNFINGADNLGKNLKKVNDELERQVQSYKVIYGQLFSNRGFYNMLGQIQQPTYSSFKTASGVELQTTGGLTPITIQNMTVRNDGDIVKIASELEKLQKKDARKTGHAYGF